MSRLEVKKVKISKTEVSGAILVRRPSLAWYALHYAHIGETIGMAVMASLAMVLVYGVVWALPVTANGLLGALIIGLLTVAATIAILYKMLLLTGEFLDTYELYWVSKGLERGTVRIISERTQSDLACPGWGSSPRLKGGPTCHLHEPPHRLCRYE